MNKTKNINGFAAVAAVIAGLLLLGAAGYFFYQNQNASRTEVVIPLEKYEIKDGWYINYNKGYQFKIPEEFDSTFEESTNPDTISYESIDDELETHLTLDSSYYTYKDTRDENIFSNLYAITKLPINSTIDINGSKEWDQMKIEDIVINGNTGYTYTSDYSYPESSSGVEPTFEHGLIIFLPEMTTLSFKAVSVSNSNKNMMSRQKIINQITDSLEFFEPGELPQE